MGFDKALNRRSFLGQASGMGMAMALGSSFWSRALGGPVQPGPSPYGELLAADRYGLQLPRGFTSRVVAESLTPVANTAHVWHTFPDGGACVPTDDGWIYVSNSEVPVVGGVGAIRFDSDGGVVDAYPILTGSSSNCAGGLTPWGTWLSCEEWESTGGTYAAGRVWECDPFGGPAVDRPSLGRFQHEMAAVDSNRRHVYLSEDQPDGLLYRYSPPEGVWGSGDALAGGAMETMAVGPDGTVTWLPVEGAEAPSAPLRGTVPGATRFDGGEGVVYDDGHVYLTTKGDERVWVYDIAAATMTVLYDGSEFPDPVLSGVDNIIVSAAHDLYLAEDGGNLEVCTITPDLTVAPVVRMTGPQLGSDSGTALPIKSEVTGLALSPDGNRLYFSSQRGSVLAPVGPGPGVLYEVTGPFRGGTLAVPPPRPEPVPTTGARPGPSGSEPDRPVPASGFGRQAIAASAAAAAGAGLWAFRRRTGASGD